MAENIRTRVRIIIDTIILIFFGGIVFAGGGYLFSRSMDRFIDNFLLAALYLLIYNLVTDYSEFKRAKWTKKEE